MTIKMSDDYVLEDTEESMPEPAHVYLEGGVGILGMGAYLPEKILTNADLEKIVDTTDEWIVKRTGISERRIIAEGETTAGIAVTAAMAALADAGVDGGKIGMVIVATATPDSFAPATASLVQRAIGADNCAAFDLNAGCTGSLYGLIMAQAYVKSGACDYALVIGSEALSRVIDWKDRRTCVLFGDGAGAAVLGRKPEGVGFLASLLRSDGDNASMITIPAFSITNEDLERRNGVKKSTVWLEGGKVMKFASRTMSSSICGVTAAAGFETADLKLVVPHQANGRIIENAARRLDLRDDQVFVNVNKYGNTSAASLLIALMEAVAAGRLTGGDLAVLVAFGAGLTYGAALLRW